MPMGKIKTLWQKKTSQKTLRTSSIFSSFTFIANFFSDGFFLGLCSLTFYASCLGANPKKSWKHRPSLDLRRPRTKPDITVPITGTVEAGLSAQDNQQQQPTGTRESPAQSGEWVHTRRGERLLAGGGRRGVGRERREEKGYGERYGRSDGKKLPGSVEAQGAPACI